MSSGNYYDNRGNAINATALQGTLISTQRPIATQVLYYDASARRWQPKNMNELETNAVYLGGVAVTGSTPTNGDILQYNSSTNQWELIQGTALDSHNAFQLQGTAITTTAPSSGMALVYNGSAWDPQYPSFSGNATSLQGYNVNSGYPGSGNYLYFDGSQWTFNTAGSNATSLQGYNVVSGYPGSGNYLYFDGSQWTFNNPGTSNDAHYFYGQALSGTTASYYGQIYYWNGSNWTPSNSSYPSSGYVLAWNGSEPQWQSVTDSHDAHYFYGQSLSGSTASTQGQLYYWNGSNWTPSNTTSPSSGNVLTWNGSEPQWGTVTDSHDAHYFYGQALSGSTASAQGQLYYWNGSNWTPSNTTSPSSGNVLTWNGSEPQWSSATDSHDAHYFYAQPLDGSTANTLGQVHYWDGSYWRLSYTTSPSTGRVLTWNGSLPEWQDVPAPTIPKAFTRIEIPVGQANALGSTTFVDYLSSTFSPSVVINTNTSSNSSGEIIVSQTGVYQLNLMMMLQNISSDFIICQLRAWISTGAGIYYRVIASCDPWACSQKDPTGLIGSLILRGSVMLDLASGDKIKPQLMIGDYISVAGTTITLGTGSAAELFLISA